MRRFNRIRARAIRRMEEIGFVKSTGPKNRSDAPSNARFISGASGNSGIVVVVVWLMKTNEKRGFTQKVCPVN